VIGVGGAILSGALYGDKITAIQASKTNRTARVCYELSEIEGRIPEDPERYPRVSIEATAVCLDKTYFNTNISEDVVMREVSGEPYAEAIVSCGTGSVATAPLVDVSSARVGEYLSSIEPLLVNRVVKGWRTTLTMLDDGDDLSDDGSDFPTTVDLTLEGRLSVICVRPRTSICRGAAAVYSRTENPSGDVERQEEYIYDCPIGSTAVSPVIAVNQNPGYRIQRYYAYNRSTYAGFTFKQDDQYIGGSPAGVTVGALCVTTNCGGA
jgi:hypothetical protein